MLTTSKRHKNLLAKEADLLQNLFDYYIKEEYGDPIPFGMWKKISLFLDCFALTAGIYALPVVRDYSKKQIGFIDYSLQLNAPFANTVFMLADFDALLATVAMPFRLPARLSVLLNKTSKKELFLTAAKVTIAALTSAFSFSLLLSLSSTSLCQESVCSVITLSHSLVVNTFLQLIPWTLIFTSENKFFRLPLLPFQFGWQQLSKAFTSSEENKLLAIRKDRQAIYDKYTLKLSRYFLNAANNIVNAYSQYGYRWDAASLLKKLQHSETPVHVFDEVQPKATSIDTSLHKDYLRYLAMSAHFLGAAFMATGCASLIIRPIQLAREQGFSLPISFAIGFLPAYSTGVLFSFYGAKLIESIYKTLFVCKQSLRSTLSFEASYYPKSFMAFCLLAGYLSTFAYGTGIALNKQYFPAEVEEIISIFTLPALGLLSFSAYISLFNQIANKLIITFSTHEDDKLAARLLAKTHLMVKRLKQSNGTALMDSLNHLVDEQDHTLSIAASDLESDQVFLRQLDETEDRILAKQNSESHKSWFTFWRKDKQQENPWLLLNPTTNYSYPKV